MIPSMLELLPEAAGSFAAGLLEAVLNGMWQGVLLTALVATVLRLIRRPNAATRYVMWWACLLMVVLLPAISYGWRLGEGWFGDGAASAATMIGSAPALLLPGGFWPVLIAGCWLAVSAYLLLRLGAAYVAMQRLKRRSEPLLEDDDAIGVLVDSHPSLPRVVLRRSDGISSPMTAGLARPMILLPNQVLESLSRAELRHVVLHELTHVERNDDRTVLVQRILEALFFFHPAVFWIGRRLDLEREIACDHRVAALTGDAKAYARCLTRLAELQPAARRSLLASGALLSRRHLVRRVRVLLEDSRERGRDLVSGKIALGGTVGCLAVVAWFATLAPVLEIPPPRTSDGMLVRANASPAAPVAVRPGLAAADSSAGGDLRSAPGASEVRGVAGSAGTAGSSASADRPRVDGSENRGERKSADATELDPETTAGGPTAGADAGTHDPAGESRARSRTSGGTTRGVGEQRDSHLEFGSLPGPSMPPSAQDSRPAVAQSADGSATGAADGALKPPEYRQGQRIDAVSGRAEDWTRVADGLDADPHDHPNRAERTHRDETDRRHGRPDRRDRGSRDSHPDRHESGSRDGHLDRGDRDRNKASDSHDEECEEEDVRATDASDADGRDRIHDHDRGGPLP